MYKGEIRIYSRRLMLFKVKLTYLGGNASTAGDLPTVKGVLVKE